MQHDASHTATVQPFCHNQWYVFHIIHTHTRLTALFPGLPRWAGTRKVKPIWILLKQETVSGSGISWTICKSATRSSQITTPAPLKFFTGRMPFLPPKQQRQSTEGMQKEFHIIHTHTFNGPLSGTNRVSQYQKGKTNLDSEWQWHQLGMCKSAPRSRQMTTPAPPHHSVFYRPDALPAAQPTASKHCRHISTL